VAGCILILFNARTLRALAFPIAFLLFLAPPPLEIVYPFATELSTTSSEASFTLLKAIGLPVSLTEQYEVPVIVLTKPASPPLTFAIDIACSGIYSLIGFLIFAVFVTYIARGPSWKKATLFLLGFPLIYIMNILRMTIIVLIGNSFGMELALQTFHLLGGWTLIFLGTLLLLITSERILKIQLFTRKSKMISCPGCVEYSGEYQNFCYACGRLLKPGVIRLHKRDIAKIAVMVSLMVLILTIQVPVFALTEGPAEVTVTTLTGNPTSTQILPDISNYTLKFIFRDTAFEETAKQDATLTYAYIPFNNNSKEIIWVTMEIAKSRSSVHRWEACLIQLPLKLGKEPKVTQLDLRDVELVQNPPKVARFFAFTHKKTNLTQVVLYWYENTVFQSNSTMEQEYVKTGVMRYIDGPDEVYDAENQLLQFGKAIANYWRPTEMWSEIAMGISQNATNILTIATLLLAVIIVVETMRSQMNKRRNLTIYNKLSQRDKLILRAIHKANEKEHPTTNEVMSSYNKISEEKVELSAIIERLDHLKEMGLTELNIASWEDTPIMIWKAQTPIPKLH
jgi:exosortase